MKFNILYSLIELDIIDYIIDYLFFLNINFIKYINIYKLSVLLKNFLNII